MPPADDPRTPARTVGELVAALSRFDPSLPVEGAWEGTGRPVADVVLVDGIVCLDVDGGWLRAAARPPE